MITIPQAAEKHGVSKVTIYSWLKQGLPYFKIRHGLMDKIRIDEKELDKWVDSQRNNGDK